VSTDIKTAWRKEDQGISARGLARQEVNRMSKEGTALPCPLLDVELY
jgi:hypothetical protein